MYTHAVKLRVRYGETDQMGYVYYGHYAAYCEVARVEALRNLGMSYKQLEAEGIMLPVLEHHAFYQQPAFYDDELTIAVSIKTLPTAVIQFQYVFQNEAGTQIHRAETRLAFIQSVSKRPCRPPKQLLFLLEPYFS